MAVESSPVVLRDAFPAEVNTGDVLWRAARFVLSESTAYVFVERDGAPAPVLAEPWTREDSTIRHKWSSPPFVVKLADGRVLYVNRDTDCGCRGSVLRSAHLFTGTARSST